MNNNIIDWELDEEEVQIIKDYITVGCLRHALTYYIEKAREEVIKHHIRKQNIV